MRLPEQKLWDTMKRQNKAQEKPLTLERVENAAGAGMPDVHVRARGIETWVELKVAKLPKRATTRVMGSKGLNPYQINWHLQQASFGLSSFVLLRDDENGVYLLPGRLSKHMNDYTREELRICAMALSWGRAFQVLNGINV